MDRTLFLTIASKSSGLGHLMRCSAIADALEDKGFETHFLIETESSINFSKSFQTVNWTSELEKIIPELNQYQSIFIDANELSLKLLEEIDMHAKKLVFIDDYYRWAHENRLIIDWTVNAEYSDLHEKKESSQYLLGTKYAAMRREFWKNTKKVIKEDIKNVLITFGGSDIRNITPKIVSIFKKNFPEIRMHIIIGSGYNNKEEIEAEACDKTNFIFYPDAKMMKETMMSCDIAIASGGQTLYELAAVGLPTIAITLIDNQIEDTKGFEKIGFLLNAGWWEDRSLKKNIKKYIDKISSYSERKKMSDIGQRHIDGNGAARIANNIFNNK